MPKKAVLLVVLLAVVASIVSYRLGSTPVAQAKPRPSLEEPGERPADLPSPPATWTLTGGSSYDSEASVTQPAGGAGVQHVAICIAFSFNNSSAGKLDSTAILRDGASATGTPLWQYNFQLQPGESIDHSVCDLKIVGSAATAMTFEMNAYGPAVGGYVNLTGYDAQAK